MSVRKGEERKIEEVVCLPRVLGVEAVGSYLPLPVEIHCNIQQPGNSMHLFPQVLKVRSRVVPGWSLT